MTDSSENSVDTTQDPAAHSKGRGADDAQSPGERAEAVREFDDHSDDEGPNTLDGSEEEHDGNAQDDGKTLPAPHPMTDGGDVTDPKATTRTE
ncbi:autophagy-related protein 2 [Actinomycetes bacterium M1A6_2h]